VFVAPDSSLPVMDWRRGRALAKLRTASKIRAGEGPKRRPGDAPETGAGRVNAVDSSRYILTPVALAIGRLLFGLKPVAPSRTMSTAAGPGPLRDDVQKRELFEAALW